jgi:hypothetical protein
VIIPSESDFSALSVSNACHRSDRLFFVPEFGGSFAADDSLGDWLRTRGIHPDKLQVEPLENTYADLPRSTSSESRASPHMVGSNPTVILLSDWKVTW